MSTPVLRPPAPNIASRAPSRTGGRWLAAGPVALAAVVAFAGVTGRSLGFDEGATVAIASQHGSSLWAGIAHDGGNMSGFYLLLHVLIGVFGNGLLVLRFVSALAVVATVALIGAIARRLFDPIVALAAGVLAAVSLPLVYWGQTARGYAPMVAMACAGMLAFIALVAAGDGEPGPGRGPWIAYVVAMTLAMYFSFVAVLVVPAQLLVVVGRRRAWRRLGSALGVIALLCVPLVVLAVRRGSGQLFWVPRPSRMVDTQVLQSLTSAGLSPSFHPTATTYLLMWATVGAVAGLAADLAWRRWRGEVVWGRALTLGWCVVPAAITFLYSLVSQPVFVPRNVLSSTPAVSLALASALAGGRRRRALVGAAVVAVVALRALQLVPSYGVSPEPWSTVTAAVQARARPGDCIVFYPLDARMAFQYYVGTGARADARAPRSILPIIPWGRVRPYVEDYATLSASQLAVRSEGCRRVWLVSSHEGQSNGPPQSRANRTRYFSLQAELERRFGFAPVASYGYASTIHVQLFYGRSVRP